jgi:hypothetical protein
VIVNGNGVKMEYLDLSVAGVIGTMRHATATVKGWPDKAGFKGEGYDIHTLGVLGEMTVCAVMGWYYNPTINTFKAPDVGVNIDVKTRPRHDWDLIVRPGDPEDRVYVLVTGRKLDFQVRGWVYGHEVAALGWWGAKDGERAPCWWIGQDRLRPLETLRDADMATAPAKETT